MMKAAQILLLAVAMVAVTDSLPLAAPSPEDVHPVIPLESVKESLRSGQVETKSPITEVKSEDASSVAVVDIVEQKLKEAKSAEPEAAKPIEETPSIVLPTEGEAAAKPVETKETIVETPKEEVKKIDTPEVESEESKPVVARSEESSPKTEEINTAEVPIPISAEKSLVTETKEAEAAVLSTEEKIASALPAAKELPHEASLIVDSIVKDQSENLQKQEEKIVDIAERVTRGGKITPDSESPEKSEVGQEEAAIVTPVEKTSIPKLVSEAVDSVSRSVEESKKELSASIDNAQSAAASEKIVEATKVAEQESRKVEDAVSEIKEEPAVKEEIKGEKEGSLILEEGSAATENEEKKEETELKEEKPAAAEEKPKELQTPAAEDLPNAEQLTDNNQPKKPEPEAEKSEETSQESSEESSSSEESEEEKKVSKHDEDSSQEESIEKSETGKISTSEK
ncbi:neurofilament heavy polypeptide [Neodiprion lecontei]|uniref:Neurofilament heavy polypeptide n=1 Tax=Neodiprion lecontei TaxID=441921 RepID=A0A6J0BGU3_NEOLC|nr:neurofilament heavy polypeptide [Neodiprion lecontei]